MHTDYEAVLLEDGTQQEFIWDTDWNPESHEATLESLINIRLHQNNRSLYLQTTKRTKALNNQQNQKEPREIRGALFLVNYATGTTLLACGPLGPCSTLNSTFYLFFLRGL